MTWLRNLSVGSKIGLGFAAIGFIFFFNVNLILELSNERDVLNDRIAELRTPTARYSLMLLNGINHSLASQQAWLLMGDERYKMERRQTWSREIDLPLEVLTTLSKRWTNPENHIRLKNITEKLKDLKAYQEKIESLPSIEGWEKANEILSEKATPTAQAITALARDMATNQQELLKIDLRESRKISDHGQELLLATLVVSVFLGFLVAVPITLSITRPLQRITEFSKSIASGDLQQESVSTVSRDEIGILTDNMNQMVFGLLSNLKEKEARNFAILYNIVDPLIEINDKGVITTFNPAAVKVFGYRASEVMGKNVKMLIPDSYQKEHDQYIANYKKTRKPKLIGVGRELVGKRKDGSLFPMDLSVNEFKVKNQTRYVGICRDITERKRTEASIQKARKDLEKQNRLIAQIAELSDRVRGDQDSIEVSQNIISCLG